MPKKTNEKLVLDTIELSLYNQYFYRNMDFIVFRKLISKKIKILLRYYKDNDSEILNVIYKDELNLYKEKFYTPRN